jgi:hypothetical protein
MTLSISFWEFWQAIDIVWPANQRALAMMKHEPRHRDTLAVFDKYARRPAMPHGLHVPTLASQTVTQGPGTYLLLISVVSIWYIRHSGFAFRKNMAVLAGD